MARDPSIPSFSIINEPVNIHFTIPSTQAKVYDQGYTYNQAGLTYNQAGVAYGGIYNQNQDIIPILTTAKIEQPTLNILSEFLKLTSTQTQAQVKEQGYSYNQAGVTYNQLGVMYGGIYNQNQDIIPMDLSFADIYKVRPAPPIPGKHIPLGPGFFLFIPQ